MTDLIALLRTTFAASAWAMLVLLTGCGGGGGGGGATNPGAPPPTSTVLQVVSTAADGTALIDGAIADGTLDVDPTVPILVNFNEAVNATTVTSGSFVLVGNGASVAVSATAGTTSITLQHDAPLALNTHYELTVKAGIGAQNGTVLASDYTVGFTTAPLVMRSVNIAPMDQQLLVGSPPLIAAGDLNGDGRTDVVQLYELPESVLSFATQGYSLRLFTQNADGTFALLQEIDTITSQQGYSMIFPKVFIADIDGDGIPEIIVPEFSGQDLPGSLPGDQVSGIRVYKRGSTGLYAASSFVPTRYTQYMTMLDVDGDGRPDFIGTTLYQPGFQVVLNTRVGLSPSTPVSDMQCACEFAVADLNHDGHRQLIVNNAGQLVPITLNLSPPSVSVYSIDASGGLTPDAALTQSMSSVCSGFYTCSMMVVLDINGDGLPDLLFGSATTLTVNGGGTVPYFRQPGGGFTEGTPFSLGGDLQALVPSDTNGDGTVDLVVVVTVGPANIVAALFTQGSETFMFSPAFQIPEFETLVPGAVAIADVNGDGLPDVVVVGQNEGVIAMLQVK